MNWLEAFDYSGTFVFAISGALSAVKHELDVLGVLALALATGVGGGILRDVLLGDTPPAVFHNEIYWLICLAGGLLVFFLAGKIASRWATILWADAIGLGVFAAIGASKALAHGMGPIGVGLLGMLTAVGGGVVRDVLVCETPAILHTGFYASAAILGSLSLYFLHRLGAPASAAFCCAAALTAGSRFWAIHAQLHLPKAKFR